MRRLLLQLSTPLLYVGLALTGCAPSESTSEQMLSGMGCSVNTPDPRACDPADTMKTTVCHIPPGNPANAHTICVGNPAVPAHLAHGDFVGTCSCTTDDAGVPPPPPPPDDDAGVPPPPPPPDAGTGSGSGSGTVG